MAISESWVRFLLLRLIITISSNQSEGEYSCVSEISLMLISESPSAYKRWGDNSYLVITHYMHEETINLYYACRTGRLFVYGRMEDQSGPNFGDQWYACGPVEEITRVKKI